MRVLTGVAWLWLLLGLGSCGGEDPRTGPYETRYDVVVESAAARQLSRGMIWLSLPTVSSASVDVQAADADARLIEDNLGNRQLAIEMDEVPVGYRRPVSVTVTVVPGSEQSAAVAELPGGTFSAAEPRIEADDPKLQEKGQSLRGINVQQTVTAVENFVATLGPRQPASVGDGVPAAPDASAIVPVRGALAAFESGEADAVDRVLLTVALLRAASIPARLVAGFLDDGDGALTSNELRVWAEYQDRDAWQPALPAGADETTRAIVFRVFSNAEGLSADSLLENLYQGVGLKISLAR